jgi:uncharacterized protein YfaS (alpha-2-macroglobulin family)
MRRHYRPASSFVCLFCWFFLVLSFLCAVRTLHAQSGLSVVSSGPTGEIAAREQANEIRVVFSEPMVALGRIPDPVVAPFFRIRPALRGRFRWSGTTILIFTPDQDRPLPYATTYEVTIDAGATAASGRTLSAPHRFHFTTPTVRLLHTNWIRRTGRYDAPVQIFVRFNQSVNPVLVFPHLAARYEKHDFDAPVIPPSGIGRLRQSDPAGLQKFEAKVNAARAAAQSEAPVPLALARTWDQTAYPRAPDLVVLDTTIVPPPDGWIRLTVGPNIPALQGRAVPGVEQQYTVQLPPTLFVDGFRCVSACDPDEYNAAHFRGNVRVDVWKSALAVSEVTTEGKETPVKSSAPRPRENPLDAMSYLTLEDGGRGPQPPARTWLVRVDPSLAAIDGQTLGYPWIGTIENWHQRAFTSFGDGHGVWESSGGTALPFYARNFRDVRQWTAKLDPHDLWSTAIDLQRRHFRTVPPGDGIARRLAVTPDTIQSHGLDLSAALGTAKTGLVWAGIREGAPIAKSRVFEERIERSTIVQVTNLGISVKDSPDNTLIFVTRLDNGEPVPGANITIINAADQAYWKGVTGAEGVVVAPATKIRDPRRWWEFSFIVTAEKDGDLAYVGSDWNEGIQPWEFGNRYDPQEAEPLLRGSVFSDRGVYRLGEEIHFKAMLREDTPKGIALLKPGRQVFAVVSDAEGREIDRRSVKVNDWSSTEWTMRLPQRGALGGYAVFVSLREPPKAGTVNPEQVMEPEAGEEAAADEAGRFRQTISNHFLVAAYRRPEFRVDVTLTGAPSMAGATLTGAVTARYLFGAPMAKASGKYRLFREREYSVPPAILERFSGDQYQFIGYAAAAREEVGSEDVELTSEGTIEVDHETPLDLEWPYRYTLEGDVVDVSRQHIAGRASVVVHPAPWYLGIRLPSYFVQQKNGLSTALVAVTPDGTVTAGVPIEVTLTRTQYHSVRRAEGNGFYTWETTTEETKEGTWKLTSAAEPVPLNVPLSSGGSFTLTAHATDAEGRSTTSELSFYSLGAGYTAWARYDHNRIDLVPERTVYKPGETARIMIQSPWEQATALLTTEREGVRHYQQFSLTSTQQTVSVPIGEPDIPNLYVSVLLVKGRTKAEGATDASDPGKPSFRLGYVELKVEDAAKRLSVSVKANKDEYRPAGAATVEVTVKDAAGKPASSEVTLWAVDYGVLSLTAYRTPDVLSSVYVAKALQVMNEDNRQRIVSRRVLTPKGDTEGGGGGSETGASSIRKDFRVLAFWLGSVQTDASGRAITQVKLPESLTTYRIMAVSGDRQSRFGAGDSEIRINKPLLLRAAFPRFLAMGDRAHFGAAVTNQMARGGRAVVTIQSLDPALLAFGASTKQSFDLGAGATEEVRFDAQAKGIGRARVRMTVRMGAESDAFEESIPVEVLVAKETVAAYGEAKPEAREVLAPPPGVMTSMGGLDVSLSSTALVGLGEGARYVVDYPYGCAEQRSSRALVMIYAADLGGAFPLPGIAPDKLRSVVQENVDELPEFQCPNGAFTYWKGECPGEPYLTSYVLHVLQSARDFKYTVSPQVLDRAASYLEGVLAAEPPTNEGWWPAYTAWQSFASRVLVHAGRKQDSNMTRLYGYRTRMPVFALAHLYDAIATTNPADPRLADLQARITSAILPEAGMSHVEELADPYLLWFWNSNIRTTAIVLDTMTRQGINQPSTTAMARWLLQVRKNGRWSNTQENAWALSALVSYYKRYEAEAPDFRAVARLGRDELTTALFKGRSTDAVSSHVPMSKLLAGSTAGGTRDLVFQREGRGTLFYAARLQYVNAAPVLQGTDMGIRIQRRYEKYVDGKPVGAAGTSFAAGDLVRVTISFDLPKERRFVAVTDPLPAGLEPIETWFATTAQELADKQRQNEEAASWFSWWKRGGFDHVERHDDRVQLFGTRLAEGTHEFSYITRATTAGSFVTAPAYAEEMYTPEVFGRTGTMAIEVKK